ncbi:MAG: class I SAM-dependent methyltransferase [Chloroflexota bacterium]|nr:class I SAM-dependent methyltransferase [Chloroflexota bacterium]
MEHRDHLALLRDGIADPGGVWADLGAGWGAFTLALADLLGSTGTIYALDRDRTALREAAQAVRARFPAITLHSQVADFTQPLDLPPLDGIVMANALHFVRDKAPVLAHIAGLLRPGGRLILVEYDADRGNPWVPHPLAYPTWATLAARAGFRDTRRLATVPSRFLGAIYSALSFAP